MLGGEAWRGGRPSEHPHKGLPVSQPELELSFSSEQQCFLESLPGWGSLLGCTQVPTWRDMSSEETETRKACHFDIVPIFQLLCAPRLSSGGRKEV